LSCFFSAVISAPGTVLETGNFAVLAQEVINATTPMIARFLIIFIFLNLIVNEFPHLKVEKSNLRK